MIQSRTRGDCIAPVAVTSQGEDADAKSLRRQLKKLDREIDSFETGIVSAMAHEVAWGALQAQPSRIHANHGILIVAKVDF